MRIARVGSDRRHAGVRAMLGRLARLLLSVVSLGDQVARVRLLGLGVVTLGLLVVSCAPGALPEFGPRPLGTAASSLPAEPAATAAFLAAYARADEAAADALASPLYQAEWARRNLPADARRALRLSSSPSGSAPTGLSFTFIGGMTDRAGFGHRLYLVRPAGSSDGSKSSVWRVDTDSSGRVIWLELVYLFSPGTTDLILTPPSPPTASLPTALTSLHPARVAAVRSGEGAERYYALGRPAATSKGTAAGASPESLDAVTFVGVDSEGQLRPGAWTFGEEATALLPYGTTPTPPVVSLGPGLTALRQSYLAALCSGC